MFICCVASILCWVHVLSIPTFPQTTAVTIPTFMKIFDHKPSQPILTVVQIVACYSQVSLSLVQFTLACFDVTIGVVCNTNFDCCMAKKTQQRYIREIIKDTSD